MFLGLTFLSYGYRNFRIPLRNIHHGDKYGMSKTGGATHNILRHKNIKNKFNIRETYRPMHTRIESKFKNIIKSINRNNCKWNNKCPVLKNNIQP